MGGVVPRELNHAHKTCGQATLQTRTSACWASLRPSSGPTILKVPKIRATVWEVDGEGLMVKVLIRECGLITHVSSSSVTEYAVNCRLWVMDKHNTYNTRAYAHITAWMSKYGDIRYTLATLSCLPVEILIIVESMGRCAKAAWFFG